MFERFTDRARRVVVLAQEEVRVFEHPEVTGGDLIIGLLREGENLAARILTKAGLTVDSVRAELWPGQQQPETAHIAGHVPFSRAGKKALELALREGLQLGHNYIAPEHLLLGLIRGESMDDFFQSHSLSLSSVRRDFLDTLATDKPDAHVETIIVGGGGGGGGILTPPPGDHAEGVLKRELSRLDQKIFTVVAELNQLRTARQQVTTLLELKKSLLTPAEARAREGLPPESEAG
jgi:ATP-dependent Clp protease ATP-binding subunit ClpA